MYLGCFLEDFANQVSISTYHIKSNMQQIETIPYGHHEHCGMGQKLGTDTKVNVSPALKMIQPSVGWGTSNV
jgi:hypothetical protein